MARGLSGWQEHYAAAAPSGTTQTNRRPPEEWITSRLDGVRPGRALDVACGAGRHAVWLAEHGWLVTAVDFAPAAIERTREAARDAGVTVDARVGDCTGPADLRPEPGEPGQRGYDLVVIAFFHDLSLLKSLDDLLTPGGRVLIVVHAPSSHRGPTDPALRPTLDEVKAALPSGVLIVVAEETGDGAHLHVDAVATAG